jgi:hypothetical protein
VRYGYDLADDGRSLIDNPQEQEAIGVMHDLRESGLTLREIAAELSARGVTTKEGHSTWTHTAVAYILHTRLRVA